MINKVRVLFFGSRPLGKKALELLLGYDNVEIVGVITKGKSNAAWWRDDPSEIIEGLPSIEIDDIDKVDFDLGVSINYWRMIEEKIICRPKLGFINLHHSHNLYFRGRDMTSHAILNARDESMWYHGTCLHYTDDGLDTGPVIASKACDISEQDTAWTLFNKVEKLGSDLLEEWLPRVLTRKVPSCHPSGENPLNYRKNLKRELDVVSISDEQLYDFVRAFDFNNLFEPAYYLDSESNKVFLTIDKHYGKRIFVCLDDNRSVYFNDCYGESNDSIN